MSHGPRNPTAWITVGLVGLGAWGTAARGDDVALDEQSVPQPGVFGIAAQTDLGQVFDSIVFGGQVTGEPLETRPHATAGDVLASLDGVRRRAEMRIAAVDRIVGLADGQRRKLEIAAESDLRRLTDAIVEARQKHVGRTLRMDPRDGSIGKDAQKEIQEAQEDAHRCRDLVQAACGPKSLLGKVLVGTLDEEQSRRYSTVMQGRNRCRWEAIVAAGLELFDDQMGLTQQQHATLTALLLDDVPPLEDGPRYPAGAMPAGILVAQRLTALGDSKLGEILDPRQRSVIARFCPPGGNAFPMSVLQAMPAVPLVPR